MMTSAEIRWFWKDAPPPDVERWFNSSDKAGGGRKPRTDRYFGWQGAPELSVKIRDEEQEPRQVEIKGLVTTLPPDDLGLDARAVEIWCKWRTAVSPAGKGLQVQKLRRLRKFAADDALVEIALDEAEQVRDGTPPLAGCNVELTRVVLPECGDVWWTLGFEAFGGLDRVPAILVRAVRTLRPPGTAVEAELSYPAWLKAFYAP